jgi:hypothetical protein
MWGAPSDERPGLLFTTAAGGPFSGPSPVGLVTIFYYLRFETSLFVVSYDSHGYGGGIRPRLLMGRLSCKLRLAYNLSTEPRRKPRFQYFHCCMRIRFRGNVLTEPLPRNGYGISVHLAVNT